MQLYNETVFDHAFEGRCPSKAQVAKVAKFGMKTGATHLELWWGENMITMVKAGNSQWYGSGWIRRTSGTDLALEIQLGKI